MRRLALLALLFFPTSASAQAEAPVETDGSGGAEATLVAERFSVAPGKVVAGSPVTVSLLARGPVTRVRARVTIGRAVLKLGRVPVGRTVTRRWTPAVAAGSYTARLALRGRTALSFPVTVGAAPAMPLAATTDGVFPIRGEYTFGDGFGADRGDHSHQGQDISAAKGTPLVSPVAGTVFWRKVQPRGAGHYLVIRSRAGVDYVFMHLVAGSELVDKGDAVRAGQQIGQVGSTGDSSGPHLHFEIWPDGWYAPKSKPIDPLAQLQAWA